MAKQIQVRKQGTRREPAPGTPGDPDTRTPSGVRLPY